MKKEKIGKKIIAATLIPSILLPSCGGSDYFVGDDVVSINNSIHSTERGIAVPVNLSFNSKDKQLLDFITCLSNDIVQNPLIAKQFAENPQSIAQAYKITNLKIDFDDPFWKLIIALGDKEISEAITKSDIGSFLSLCSSKGLISDVKKSDLVQYMNQLGSNNNVVTPRMGVMVAPVAVFVAAVAGCAAGGAAAVVYYETYYWTDGSRSRMSMSERDAAAYQVWALKKGAENTHIMLSEYQEKIVNDCIEGLRMYFPERLEGINMVELRQFISLNMPN